VEQKGSSVSNVLLMLPNEKEIRNDQVYQGKSD